MTGEDKKNILVVDDEKDVQNYLKAALVDVGFNVVVASDGQEALEAVKKSPPDLVSLDLVMPKHSGVKFYREMQKNSQWSKIPILIVTGHSKDDLGKSDFDELTMSGPGIYLEKPVKPDNYVAAVQQLLGIEPTVKPELKTDRLRGQLEQMLDGADAIALQKALNALKKKE